ncbi:hypothetical protein JCM11641_001891 [Rhodosporidiobolus odoratus]
MGVSKYWPELEQKAVAQPAARNSCDFATTHKTLEDALGQLKGYMAEDEQPAIVIDSTNLYYGAHFKERPNLQKATVRARRSKGARRKQTVFANGLASWKDFPPLDAETIRIKNPQSPDHRVAFITAPDEGDRACFGALYSPPNRRNPDDDEDDDDDDDEMDDEDDDDEGDEDKEEYEIPPGLEALRKAMQETPIANRVVMSRDSDLVATLTAADCGEPGRDPDGGRPRGATEAGAAEEIPGAQVAGIRQGRHTVVPQLQRWWVLLKMSKLDRQYPTSKQSSMTATQAAVLRGNDYMDLWPNLNEAYFDAGLFDPLLETDWEKLSSADLITRFSQVTDALSGGGEHAEARGKLKKKKMKRDVDQEFAQEAVLAVRTVRGKIVSTFSVIDGTPLDFTLSFPFGHPPPRRPHRNLGKGGVLSSDSTPAPVTPLHASPVAPDASPPTPTTSAALNPPPTPSQSPSLAPLALPTPSLPTGDSGLGFPIKGNPKHSSPLWPARNEPNPKKPASAEDHESIFGASRPAPEPRAKGKGKEGEEEEGEEDADSEEEEEDKEEGEDREDGEEDGADEEERPRQARGRPAPAVSLSNLEARSEQGKTEQLGNLIQIATSPAIPLQAIERAYDPNVFQAGTSATIERDHKRTHHWHPRLPQSRASTAAPEVVSLVSQRRVEAKKHQKEKQDEKFERWKARQNGTEEKRPDVPRKKRSDNSTKEVMHPAQHLHPIALTLQASYFLVRQAIPGWVWAGEGKLRRDMATPGTGMVGLVADIKGRNAWARLCFQASKDQLGPFPAFSSIRSNEFMEAVLGPLQTNIQLELPKKLAADTLALVHAALVNSSPFLFPSFGAGSRRRQDIAKFIAKHVAMSPFYPGALANKLATLESPPAVAGHNQFTPRHIKLSLIGFLMPLSPRNVNNFWSDVEEMGEGILDELWPRLTMGEEGSKLLRILEDLFEIKSDVEGESLRQHWAKAKENRANA